MRLFVAVTPPDRQKEYQPHLAVEIGRAHV